MQESWHSCCFQGCHYFDNHVYAHLVVDELRNRVDMTRLSQNINDASHYEVRALKDDSDMLIMPC